MPDVVWCIPTRGITYSVSHHAGCCLVHPDMWYHLFGLPSCRMSFGASRHVVSLIRSPIMPDAVWCIPTHGNTYSVSHHAGCCLVHPDMWYQLNVIRHQDGCRLVHPAKWDISSMPYAIMTDADWCIPPSGTLENFGVPSLRMPICASRQAVHLIYQSIHIYDGFHLMNPVFIIIHIYSVFKYHISISILTFVFTFMTDSV